MTDEPKPHRPHRHVQLPKSIRLPHDAYGNLDAAFHVVIRAMPHTAPFAEPSLAEAIWELVVQQRERSTVTLHASCLMPDHVHLVTSPGTQNLISWANSFKSFFTRVSWKFRPKAALWQPSFYDRRLRDEAEFEAAIL